MKTTYICYFANLFALHTQANNIALRNVSLTSPNTTASQNNVANFNLVQFNLSCENSWRISTSLSNWDAARLLVKYSICFNTNSSAAEASVTSTNPGGGGNAGWNLIGNPYPSAINVGQVSGVNRNNIAAFYVWNPNLATAGAYESKSFGTDYILPSGSAFFINTPSTANFTFSESDKSSSTPASLFKNSEWMQNALEITLLSDSSITWDNFTLRNRTQLTDAFEYTADGLKMKNSNVNFYTIRIN
jgi:hypothetical protein